MEWGVLLSYHHKENGNRYPDPHILEHLDALNHVRLSAHICGGMAKDVVAAETKRMHEHLGYNFDIFRRCQINLNVSARYAEMRSMRPFDRCLDEVIMQMPGKESLRSWLRYTEKPLPHVSYLLDASGGRGINTPIDIFDDDPNIRVGYAGGMNPDNVGGKLRLLLDHRSYAEFWIDMESGVRDDDVARKIECGAISPTRRFKAIKRLSDMGFKITVRIQPFILPYSEKVADRFIHTLKDYGVWGFQTEGLKLRVVMPQKEKEIYRRIGDVFGFDILEDFKTNGMIEGGDRCYSIEDKRRMLALYTELGEKYGIKFFNADNLIDARYGCGSECCGTEFLRNHKIWGGSRRSIAFDDKENCSEEIGKCLVNFTRSTANAQRTIAEVSAEFNEKETKRLQEIERKKKIPKEGDFFCK